MAYGRQQLLWQKQVTVIGSIDLDSQTDEYHTGVAQFRHIICHRRSVQRQRFQYRCWYSLLQQVAGAYSRSLCDFFQCS